MIRVFRLSRICILGALIGLALMVSHQEAYGQPRTSGSRPKSIGSATLDGRATHQLQDPSSFDPQNSRLTTAGAEFLTSAPPHVGGPPPPPPPPVPIDGSAWILILAGAVLGLYKMRKLIRVERSSSLGVSLIPTSKKSKIKLPK